MTKGERLSQLLIEADEIHLQMRQLFELEGVPYLELSSLSAFAKREWSELRIKCNSLADQMCSVILEKTTED